jgi:hypothetical protein
MKTKSINLGNTPASGVGCLRFNKIYVILVVSLFFTITHSLRGQSQSANSDNWVATDAIGRSLPLSNECRAFRNDRYVGMFYYVWQADGVADCPLIAPVSNNTNQLANGLGIVTKNKNSYWAEPEANYYRATDPWVIRRNLQMLTNAGVDFIFFDGSNGYLFLANVSALCDVAATMRSEGKNTPNIAWLVKDESEAQTLYTNFYAANLYPTQWFYWNGKPLILKKDGSTFVNSTLTNFFTTRRCWAWGNANESANWDWIDDYPQDYGWTGTQSVVEQMSVSKASHPTIPNGCSFNNGSQPALNAYLTTEYTPLGLKFNEQWSQVHKKDPKLVLITQWNEWISGVYPTTDPFLGANRGYKAIDEFNMEFSRDIEPMKGGYTDNYYYQMVSNIRKYKGMTTQTAASTPKTITIDGAFTEWSTVTPVYNDPSGDTYHRNFLGANNTTVYTNTTGRNDIIESRSTYDANNIYFYVKTSADISPYTGSNWMLLFVNSDRCNATGWEGYDYVINMGVTSSTQTTLKQWNGTAWGNSVAISYTVTGNQMELSIPRTSIAQSSEDPLFYFHWSDNPRQLNDITSFFTDGDSGPDRRFDYYFTTVPLMGIVNTGFETPKTTSYKYGPFTEGWTFIGNSTGSSGVATNGSAFGNPTAIEGTQCLLLQKVGYVTQNVNFIAGDYKISFLAAKRSGNTQSINVYYDATLIGTITPTSSTVWNSYTTNTFSATSGVHTIKLIGTSTADNTAFVDQVELVLQTPIANNGFETPAQTTFQYAPFTSGWTFVQDGSNQCGVQKNGSAWGAPTAPEGTQTAFIQYAGSFYQDFTFTAGTYKISFYAAKRSSNTTPQSINVYCDGNLIGNIIPTSSTSFNYYCTGSFTVAAGTHRIKFANSLTQGDTFIDKVSLVLGGNKVSDLTTKLEDLDFEITIYPNPTSNKITLSNIQLNSQISVFSLDGKKVYSMLKKDNSPLNIEVENWKKGVYLIHIQANNGKNIKKMIVK